MHFSTDGLTAQEQQNMEYSYNNDAHFSGWVHATISQSRDARGPHLTVNAAVPGYAQPAPMYLTAPAYGPQYHGFAPAPMQPPQFYGGLNYAYPPPPPPYGAPQHDYPQATSHQYVAPHFAQQPMEQFAPLPPQGAVNRPAPSFCTFPSHLEQQRQVRGLGHRCNRSGKGHHQSHMHQSHMHQSHMNKIAKAGKKPRPQTSSFQESWANGNVVGFVDKSYEMSVDEESGGAEENANKSSFPIHPTDATFPTIPRKNRNYLLIAMRNGTI